MYAIAILLCLGQLVVDGTARYASPFRVRNVATHDFYQWSTNSFDCRLRPLDAAAEVEAQPGTYVISCIGITGRIEQTGEELKIVYDKETYDLTVEVIGGDPAPVEPDPGRPGDFAKLTELSKRGAMKLNDRRTEGYLFDRMRVWLEGTSDTDPLEELRTSFKGEIAGVLLRRKGESRNADWLGEWRGPLNQAIEEPESSKAYRQMVAAIRSGLRAITEQGRSVRASASKPPPAITVYVMPPDRGRCPSCEQWKREQAPAFQKAGFRIRYVDSPAGPYPRYDVWWNGFERKYTRYLLPEHINPKDFSR